MKNWPFSGDVFCSFQCRKRIKMKSISDPHFLVVCFWTFLRTETENSRSLEMRVKRVPPFDFFGQNLFLTLLSKVDVKKKFMKISEFYRKILSQNVSKLSQNEEKHLTLPYDFGIFEIGKCSFLGKSTWKSNFFNKMLIHGHNL